MSTTKFGVGMNTGEIEVNNTKVNSDVNLDEIKPGMIYMYQLNVDNKDYPTPVMIKKFNSEDFSIEDNKNSKRFKNIDLALRKLSESKTKAEVDEGYKLLASQLLLKSGSRNIFIRLSDNKQYIEISERDPLEPDLKKSLRGEPKKVYITEKGG